MKTFYVHVLVPMTITVQANSPEEAEQRVLSEKDFAPQDPDGGLVRLTEDDITQIQDSEEE